MDTTAPHPHVAAPPAGPAPLSLLLAPLGGLHTVHTMDVPAGQDLLLRVRQGRVWLTREGHLEDWFLDAGVPWQATGPLRLHLSAEGGQAATLECRVGPTQAAPRR
jgi:hypothetical protein